MLIYLLCLVITGGVSWVWVGIVYSRAAHTNTDASLIQFYSALVSIGINLAVLPMWNHLHPPAPDLPVSILATVAATQLLFGAINFFMIRAMTLAMERGPNGVVWSITQSGMVLPFLMGILVFGVELTPGMAAGILLIVTSIALFGLGKNAPKTAGGGGHRPWFHLALLSFLLCGANQCFGNLASYLPRGQEVSSVFRSLWSALGAILPWCRLALVNWIRTRKGIPGSRDVPFGRIFGYAFSMQAIGIPCSYFLFYRGLDGMQRLGHGSAAYPILVCSCLAGFFLYSALFLRERTTRVQLVGAAAAFLGVLVICL